MRWVRSTRGQSFDNSLNLPVLIASRPSMRGLDKLWCHEVVELVEHMWAQEHVDRPTISQVVTTLEDLIATYR